MSVTKLQRDSAVKNAIKDSEQIMQQKVGANSPSIFFNEQLPPLSAVVSDSTRPQLVVEFGDTFVLTRRMLQWHPEHINQVVVLNMANDQQLAGGWATKAGQSQEDMLCYQSTLYATLKRCEGVYPFRKGLAKSERHGCGAIFSPGVVIFRNGPEKVFALLKSQEQAIVSVVTIAAPFKPPIVNQGGQEQYQKPQHEVELREKLRMICRLGASKGKKVLVLGAFGCGFFGNPVRKVAQVMKEVVLEKEFTGCFSFVYWFINDRRTYEIFQQAIVVES